MKVVRIISGLLMCAGLAAGSRACASIEEQAVGIPHQIYAVAAAAAVFIFAYVLARAVENLVGSAVEVVKEQKEKKKEKNVL